MSHEISRLITKSINQSTLPILSRKEISNVLLCPRYGWPKDEIIKTIGSLFNDVHLWKTTALYSCIKINIDIDNK